MRACILFFINKFIDSLHKKCVQQNQSDLKDWNKEQKTDLSLELDSTDTQYIQNYIIYMQRDKEAESGFSHALIYCKWLTEGAGLMTELDSFANCQEIRRKAAFSLTQPKPPATKSVTSIPQEVAVDKGSDKHRVLWMEIVLIIFYHGVSQGLPPFTHFCSISISLPLFSILRRAYSKVVHRSLTPRSSGEAPIADFGQEVTGDGQLYMITDTWLPWQPHCLISPIPLSFLG